MKRSFITLFIIFLSFFIIQAQEVVNEESWSGNLSVGDSELGISFLIRTLSDGSQAAFMSVPLQGVNDLPVVLDVNNAFLLNISIPMLNAGYKGVKTISKDNDGCLPKNCINGTFTQNGISLPLNLLPGEIKLNRPQTPLAPFDYETEEVVFKNESEGAILSGTLTYPIGFEDYTPKSVPVVLMVTGSGGQDRDETIFDHKPFLVIADFLARNGIASLRYDDRGVAKSTGPVEGTTTLNNLADAEAGISFLRSLDKFGKIGVLGHSEGGTIAFMMGADSSVDFLISLAGGAANGVDILVGQNRAILAYQGVDKEVADQYAEALKLVYQDRADRKVIFDKKQYITDLCSKNKLSLSENYLANLEKCIDYGGEWFTWFLGYNPAEALKKIACPTMALNGTLDLQIINSDNIPVIKANLPVNEKNLIKEYDSLNHLFQHCTSANSLNYGEIEETISEEVLTDIVNWIKNFIEPTL